MLVPDLEQLSKLFWIGDFKSEVANCFILNELGVDGIGIFYGGNNCFEVVINTYFF